MAATNINRVVMTGNLTADPELRSLPSGMSVCSMRIADEVLRFRLIKLRPGVPEAPDVPAGAPAAGRGADGTERGANGTERGAPAEARSGAPEAAGEAATSGEAEGDSGAAG